MKTVIITDSCCDLSGEFVEDNNIKVMSIRVNLRGNDIPDDLGKTLKHSDFYEAIKAGEMPTTAQVNVYDFVQEFKKHIENGDNIIYIGFSSALSGCINSATLAKETIIDEYEEADITIIDSKSASLGLGLLVFNACKLLKEGKTKSEIVKCIEENKLKVNHWFTLNDLNHLKRGGRISPTAAVVGSVLNIKPIMHVNNDGKLIPITKVKGRKKAIKTLLNKLEEKVKNPKEQVIFISHSDCLGDAESLRDLILNSLEVKDIIINEIGPAVGSHTGSGVIALFFMAENR